MSTINDDPLRFLKPRKKQFHLTPTKPVKQSSKNKQDILLKNSKITQQNNHNQLNVSSQIESNHIKEVFSLKNNIELQGLILNDNASKESPNRPKNYKPTFNSNQYNPSKYFSSEVEDYLRKKRGLKQQQQQLSPVYPKNKTELQSSQIDLSQQEESIQFIKQIQKFKISKQQKIHSQQYNSNYRQVQLHKESSLPQLQTNHQNQQQSTNSKLPHNNNFQQYVTQHRKKPTQQTSLHQNIDQNQLTFTKNLQSTPHLDSQQERNQFNELQLKPCPICTRKFNPNSYEKHIKVCEKVFVKKRKQFSSEKQRSLSNKKK